MLEIDGGDGGGQVLRTALSLSTVLKKPVRIGNIRAARPNPGLQAQHLTCALALAKICGAELAGAEKGSQSLSFTPGETRAGGFSFDVGTAGSVSLVLQAVFPALLFAPLESRLALKGGTHVAWSPDFHFLANVFVPALGLFGAAASVKQLSYGFYPKGGGEVEAAVKPCGGLHAVSLLERGACTPIEGVSLCANLPEHVATRQKHAVLKVFPNAKIKTELVRASSPGSCASLWSHCGKGFLGASSLGKLGKPAEEVGSEPALEMKRLLDSAACVDRHLADQLMLYAALAKGESAMAVPEFTEHMQTNARTIAAFTGREFAFEEKTKILRVQGISWI